MGRSSISPASPHFSQNLDRETRHRAQTALWAFFAANGAELDETYDKLVKLRHGMAKKLGFENYIELGYRRMRRVDYNAADVAKYRDAVLTHVTPLVAQIMEARRAEHGWDKVYFWDESLIDPKGNPQTPPAAMIFWWRKRRQCSMT